MDGYILFFQRGVRAGEGDALKNSYPMLEVAQRLQASFLLSLSDSLLYLERAVLNVSK